MLVVRVMSFRVSSEIDDSVGAVDDNFLGLPRLLPCAVRGMVTFSTGAGSDSLSKNALSFKFLWNLFRSLFKSPISASPGVGQNFRPF